MSLSIVITTYNRAPVVADLLRHLSAQTDPDFQVVVALDGSTDDTEQVLRTMATPYPLKWVNTHCPGYGLAMARNMGILAADGELVAIIDDDCFPEPGYVAAYKRSAKRHTITGGPRTPDSASDVTQHAKMLELARLPAGEAITLAHLREQWPRAVATECNICMYKVDLVEMGLFSERLKIYGFIGQEFFARADHLRIRYQYDSKAEIVHRRQPVGDNGLSRWRRKWQITLAQSLRPSFMTPTQYQVQIGWAKCMSESYPDQCDLPPFPSSAWVSFPYRFLRARAADVRRRYRKAMTPVG